MKRRTPIMKGSIISIGLLIGGGAVAMPMSNDNWHEYRHGVPRFAKVGMHEAQLSETRQEENFSAASLKNNGSIVSDADNGRFSKADIAMAIATFYNGILGNRNFSVAPSTHLPVSMDPVDRISIPNLAPSDFRYANAAKPTSVPEPATFALFGLGLAGLGFTRGRCKDRK